MISFRVLLHGAPAQDRAQKPTRFGYYRSVHQVDAQYPAPDHDRFGRRKRVFGQLGLRLRSAALRSNRQLSSICGEILRRSVRPPRGAALSHDGLPPPVKWADLTVQSHAVATSPALRGGVPARLGRIRAAADLRVQYAGPPVYGDDSVRPRVNKATVRLNSASYCTAGRRDPSREPADPGAVQARYAAQALRRARPFSDKKTASQKRYKDDFDKKVRFRPVVGAGDFVYIDPPPAR